MIRIAICDDCACQTKTLISFLDKYRTDRPDTKLYYKSYMSGNELMKDIDSGENFDIFLLDIIMPEKSGIEIARYIRAKDSEAPIIFLTNSPDYALDAFDVSAVQYILKPVDTAKLLSTLNKIVGALESESGKYLMFPMVGSVVKVPFSSIICIELFGRAMKLYRANDSTLLSKTIRTPFYEAVEPLLSDSRFFSPHKSYVVNMAYVEELTNKSFVMNKGIYVPIPRYRYAQSKAHYFAWLSKCGISQMGASKND